MVIMHNYPIAIVDHICFRTFVTSLNSHFKIISRNTLWCDILKMFESEKVSLKKALESSRSRIAITTDMRTTTNQKKGLHGRYGSLYRLVLGIAQHKPKVCLCALPTYKRHSCSSFAGYFVHV